MSTSKQDTHLSDNEGVIDMYAEITKDLFKSLVPDEQVVWKFEQLEHGTRTFHKVNGVLVIRVTNFIGAGADQFYVQDINV